MVRTCPCSYCRSGLSFPLLLLLLLFVPQVQEVVLLEVEGAQVSHAGVARAVSSSWGGNAAVTVLTVRQQHVPGSADQQ